MIDSGTQKRIVAVQEREEKQISIKVFSWGDLAELEDCLEDKFGIAVESFKSIQDEKGNGIGSQIFFTSTHDIEMIQKFIDSID